LRRGRSLGPSRSRPPIHKQHGQSTFNFQHFINSGHTKAASLLESTSRPVIVTGTVLESTAFTAFSVTTASLFTVAEPAARSFSVSVSESISTSGFTTLRASGFKRGSTTPARGFSAIRDAISAFLGYCMMRNMISKPPKMLSLILILLTRISNVDSDGTLVQRL
jgi:hypothetical protein